MSAARTDHIGKDPEKQSYEMEEVDLGCGENVPESDGINLQCVNSSDFVVGKQTTFNGPVTIINYAEPPEEKVDEKLSPSKEEIVIREKIINPSTVSEIKAFAEKKSDKVPGGGHPPGGVGSTKIILSKKCLKIPVIVWFLLFIVVLVGCLVFFLGNNYGNDQEDISNVQSKKLYILKQLSIKDPGTQSAKHRVTIPYNGGNYNLILREGWNARTPLQEQKQKIPVKYVVISHTATRFCYIEVDCMKLVRDIQGDHMNRSPPLADIAYSFMVGGEGNIYEGRGWDRRTAVTGFANGKNININFIGSFENLDPPTYPQTEAVKALIEYGLNNSYIQRNYSLIAANSTYATLSPGIQVYKEIKTWSHFDPNPKSHLDE